MKNIKILGSGCSRCKRLLKNVKKAVEQMKIEATVEKIEDLEEIAKYDVLMTPALVIDGDVKMRGQVPGVRKIKNIIGRS